MDLNSLFYKVINKLIEVKALFASKLSKYYEASESGSAFDIACLLRVCCKQKFYTCTMCTVTITITGAVSILNTIKAIKTSR